ncbi:putative lipoprotein [Salmonella enterica subsp. arizonae]|uniref:Putative lipoprotein n=1 Tax=Salmonella enterica subsp. arizonae TaxID=59203 RepID=A0A379TF64_SALER|nr:putative lipoprotein [Salmonella enterica subsp. arizonae]
MTYVELLDTDGILYRYRMLDSTIPSSTTVAEWEDDLSVGMASFNKAKNPPQAMHFCWDSIIDKKVYETWITFGYPVWEMMLTPLPVAMGCQHTGVPPLFANRSGAGRQGASLAGEH